MSNEKILSRRVALKRLGLAATVAFAVPTLMGASKAEAGGKRKRKNSGSRNSGSRNSGSRNSGNSNGGGGHGKNGGSGGSGGGSGGSGGGSGGNSNS